MWLFEDTCQHCFKRDHIQLPCHSSWNPSVSICQKYVWQKNVHDQLKMHEMHHWLLWLYCWMNAKFLPMPKITSFSSFIFGTKRNCLSKPDSSFAKWRAWISEKQIWLICGVNKVLAPSIHYPSLSRAKTDFSYFFYQSKSLAFVKLHFSSRQQLFLIFFNATTYPKCLTLLKRACAPYKMFYIPPTH